MERTISQIDTRPLTDHFAAAPQVPIEALKEASQAGIEVLINNRPDREDPDQPDSEAMARAAQDVGLEYLHLPVGPDGISQDMVATVRELLDNQRKTLAYCRTGMRSAVLWAIAEMVRGTPRDEVVERGRAAGYDLETALSGSGL